jgi:hypothetical protein
MNVRAVCEAGFTLPLPLAGAVPLFTAEGERRWAGPSWDPVYAIAESEDGSALGTVFTTKSEGGEERRDDGFRYARVVPGMIAGTIDVSCAPVASAEETRVTVTYDVTSLDPEGVAFVEELEQGYDAFIESWREEIVAALGSAA